MFTFLQTDLSTSLHSKTNRIFKKRWELIGKIYNEILDSNYLLHLTEVVKVFPTAFGGVVVGAVVGAVVGDGDVPDAIIIIS